MITFNGKQVIVVGVNSFGDSAVVHYVEALGKSCTVRIQDLRADTIQELEDALTSASVLPSEEELAEREELDSLAE